MEHARRIAGGGEGHTRGGAAVPLLVLANKVDKPGAAPDAELREALQLQEGREGEAYARGSVLAGSLQPTVGRWLAAVAAGRLQGRRH